MGDVVNLSEPAASVEAPDPYDFKSIRLNGGAGEGVRIRKPLTTVPARRPGRKVWRTHPDPTHQIEVALLDAEDTGEEYLLSGAEVIEALAGLYTPVVLHTAYDSRRVRFLAKRKIPREDGLSAEWALSAARGFERAKEVWIRLKANIPLGAYEIHEAEGKIEDPEWPKESLGDLLRVAFRNRIITSVDHPLVAKLLKGAF
jgi:hypothetical protein